MTTASKPPSFFKVFFSDSSSERLQIPNAFVALTGLRERVTEEFILRNGRWRDWKVKTSCIGGRVFFEDGWGRFVEENALKNGDFIVFQSEIGSRNLFKFRIFELSSWCEKPEVKVEEEGEDKGDDDDEDDSDYVYEEEEDDDEEDDDDDEEDDDDDDGGDDDDDDKEEEDPIADKAYHIRKRGTVRGSGSKADSDHLNEYGAIAEKYFFHRDNPYFVAKTIKHRENELHIPYNIIKDFSLNLPETITLWCQYIDISSQEQIKIRENRWTDTGKLHTWKDGRVCIKGWSAFCRKNKIEATDRCICEIVLGEEAIVEMLQVHVVRKQF